MSYYCTVPQNANNSPVFLPLSSLILNPLPNGYTSSSSCPTPTHHHRVRVYKPNSLGIKAEIEIRVCVNRSCRRQGSRETLEILSSLAPPNVSVNSCGCLGRCGAGPNLVVLPGAVLIAHCGTPTRATEVLLSLCAGNNDSSDTSKNLAALALRKRGEEELEKGNFSEAELLLSQAIDLKPFGGLHIMYRSRSAARLAMGNNSGALEDANEASTIAPQYPQVTVTVYEAEDLTVGVTKVKAYICQGDAFMAMEEFHEAKKSYSIALQIDPSVRRSKSFKARIAKLQEKLTAANMPA